VVVTVEGLHPPVSSFNWKSARDAFGGEQLIPIFFTVGQPVLQVERRVGEQLAAVGAPEALGAEGGAHGLQAVPNDFLSAFLTAWRQIISIAVLAVE